LFQGVGGIDTIIANALRRGHERKVMTDIYSGGGAPAITGLLSLAGNDIANGGADYTDIVLDLETAVLEDHGITENARYILSPSAYRYLAEAAKVPSVKALIDNNLLNGYAYHKTPYLADASSGVGQIIFGDWSNCYFVRFGGIDLVIDPYGSKDTAQIEITMNQWIDFNLPQTTAFAFEDGVTAS
jgi:Phage capsid family.